MACDSRSGVVISITNCYIRFTLLFTANVQTCVVLANTPQLQRQNFCSRWTSLVELSSGPAVQSRHHLRTVQMTAEETPFSATRHSVTSDMWHLIKTLTYLLTYSAFPPSGSVNEYQLRLGRQRQVEFILLADECGVCR